MNFSKAITKAASFKNSQIAITRRTSAITALSGVRLNSCPAMTIRTPPSISSRWAAPNAAAATRAMKTTILVIDQSIMRALSVSIHILGERLGSGYGFEAARGIL